MKLSGVRTDPLAAIRRRVALKSASESSGLSLRPADSAAFLGLSETDLTPAVSAAVGRLLSEIEELRLEVSRLKAHLAEAEDLADQDVLTPLFNRRAFMRELNRQTAFAQRYEASVSLIYFDLDGFKSVNDRFGHAAGDQALQAVAERLQGQVRESDIVGRMGGDEFAVILAQADEGVALSKAESLAAVIQTEPVACGDWMAPLHVTFGVRQVRPGDTAELVLADADADMYQRKRLKA